MVTVTVTVTVCVYVLELSNRCGWSRSLWLDVLMFVSQRIPRESSRISTDDGVVRLVLSAKTDVFFCFPKKFKYRKIENHFVRGKRKAYLVVEFQKKNERTPTFSARVPKISPGFERSWRSMGRFQISSVHP